MTYEELIKRLKELNIPNNMSIRDNDYQYVRMLVSKYERDNNDYSVDICFDSFIPWEDVEQNLRKFIDDRDANGLRCYTHWYNFTSDVYHLDNYGRVEHITGEVMNDLIKDILHYLGNEEEIND